MIAYLDSSTVLRIILGQANALKEWRSITQGVASALVEVECLRTLDRLRRRGPVVCEWWVWLADPTVEIGIREQFL